MVKKLDVMRQVVTDLGSVFPKLTAWEQIYLVPKIMAVESMALLEIQVCEGASTYPEHDGSCRAEDFIILVGIFHKYRLDSGGRHSKALADLTTSLFTIKETVIDILDGKFLTGDLLTRPCIIQAETTVTETSKDKDQLLKILSFLAGLNVEMI